MYPNPLIFCKCSTILGLLIYFFIVQCTRYLTTFGYHTLYEEKRRRVLWEDLAAVAAVTAAVVMAVQVTTEVLITVPGAQEVFAAVVQVSTVDQVIAVVPDLEMAQDGVAVRDSEVRAVVRDLEVRAVVRDLEVRAVQEGSLPHHLLQGITEHHLHHQGEGVPLQMAVQPLC
jgi:hypothetical protein